MYDRILTPTDGSDVSVVAAETAFALARRFDAVVHVVHVLEDGDPGRGERLVAAVDEVAADVDVRTETAVLDDPPQVHDAIVDYVGEHEVDCVVMGTHGEAHPDRRVLGSVAERTIREAPVPVMTVNEGAALASTFDTVLVPTDGSEGAMAAAVHAVDVAAEADATIHVVHVVSSTIADDLAGTVDPLEERGRRALEAVVDVARESNVASVEASLLTGVPHRAISEYAATQDVDLVVMGTHGRSGVSRHFLGSVTERVARRVDVPVVAVSELEAPLGARRRRSPGPSPSESCVRPRSDDGGR